MEFLPASSYIVLLRSKYSAHCSILKFPSAHGKVRGKAVPVHAMSAYGESRSIASLILTLGSSWRWVVSFTPWSHYSRGKSTWHPLNWRPNEPHSCSGHLGEESLVPAWKQNNGPGVVQPVALSLYWLHYSNFSVCFLPLMWGTNKQIYRFVYFI
jgi:hypothetical protein